MEGAFNTVREKTAAKAHRIAPVVSQDTKAGTVTATFPLASVALARASKGDKGSIGFMCDPIEFTVDGAKFALKPGWVALEAR